jgi:aspartate kinase
MLGNRVVVKFGGADLSNGEKIAHAADLIVKSPYAEKVVVVSAMGKMTDNLVGTVEQIGNVKDADYAEIVSMGERTSARVFCSALKAKGANAEFIDPSSDRWPIITDSHFCDAKPDFEKTKEKVQKYLVPLLQKTIPVICGFLGKDVAGNTTTLGRGGSDTTAMLLANCLEVDEVILVKETSGVLSADPKIVSETHFLDLIEVHELFDLAQGGAKIVKAESLSYKLPNQKLRIVSMDSDDLSVGGTEVTGSLNSNSIEIIAHNTVLAINVVCDVTPDNVQGIFSVLQSRPIYGVSSGNNSITVFTSDGSVNEVLNNLHQLGKFKAISHREKVALIQVNHPTFVDSPGWVAKISNALSVEGINIIEVTTSKATINVFIEENQLTRAEKAIGDVFES